MLDSGAEVNVMSVTYYRSMVNKTHLASPDGHELRSVAGDRLSVLGVIHVPLRVAGVLLRPNVRFFVVDSVPPGLDVLLGLDFLLAHVEDINYTNLTYSLKVAKTTQHRLLVDPTRLLGPCSVRSVGKENSSTQATVAVYLACTVVLRPYSSCVVRGLVTQHRPDIRRPTHTVNPSPSTHWLFEPRTTELNDAVGISTSVTPVDGSIPVYLENPTWRSIRCRAGLHVGNLLTANEIELSTSAPADKMAVHPSRINQITVSQPPDPDILQLSQDVSIDLSNTIDMTPDQRARLVEMLQRNIGVFASDPKRTPTTNLAQHRIDTGSAPPVAVPQYRVSPEQRAVIDAQAQEMLENGVIQPSKSPYSSPVLLVKKSDGKDRFCVDFRKLNLQTKKDVYPLPRVDDVLDALGKADFFSVLDLQSGFWQIPLHPDDREKTAFSTSRGHYEFLVMPFGLCNAPSTFQRAMDQLTRDLRESCLPYMDDVITFSSRSFDLHLQHLESLFKKLQAAPMVAKPNKFKVLQKEIKFLGHVISPHTIKPDPQKTAAIFNFPTPSCVKELQSFLGLVSYYRRFVLGMATVAEPLYRLFKGNTPWVWGDVEAAAMDSLKTTLTTSPLMRLPDFDRPFTLCTDASQVGLGAVLSQVTDDGVDHPVYYASRTLNSSERNYHTTERECLAVKWACDQFRPYLLGRRFTVFTDHAALRWLFTVRDPKSKLVRWILELQEFDMDIRSRPGSANGNADALSRLPGLLEPHGARDHYVITAVTRTKDRTLPAPRRAGMDPDLVLDQRAYDEDEAIRLSIEQQDATNATDMISETDDVDSADRELPDHLEAEKLSKLNEEEPDVIDPELLSVNPNDIRTEPQFPAALTTTSNTPPTMATAQRADQDWLPIILFLEDERTTDASVTDAVRFESRDYTLHDGVLYRKWDQSKVKPRLSTQTYRAVIPESLRSELLRQFHDGVCGAHLGESKTYERIADTLFWPSMYKDITDYVQSCAKCSARKTIFHHRNTPLQSIPYPSHPFEALGIDVLGPLPTTKRGNKYIVVITDYHTRWPIAFAMKNQKASTIATLLVEQVFCQHGFPATLLSDRGSNFLSELVGAVLRVFHVKKLNTSSYHPQTNGLTERFNHTLVTMLTHYTGQNQNDWDEFLPYVLLAYRTTPHHTTKQTPFYMLYGRNVQYPFHSFVGPAPLDDMTMKIGTADYMDKLVQKLKVASDVVRARLLKGDERRVRDNAAMTDVMTFEVGDKVLLHNPIVKQGHSRKLTAPWIGPFQVIDCYPNLVNYKIHALDKLGRLVNNARSRLVHVSRLKRYHDPAQSRIRQLASGGNSGT